MLIKNRRLPVAHFLIIGFLPSFLKMIIYKLRGYKLSKGVKIGLGSIIAGKSVIIEKDTRIGLFSFIICDQCHIENDVNIGSLVYIKVDNIFVGFQTVIRENNLFGGMDIGKSKISIGHMSHIHQNCLINTTMPVEIGSNTAIGGGSYLFTHSSWQPITEGYPCTFESVKIGNNVWISWNVFILPGVSIGDGTLVSASALVTKSLPSKCLASGNPAKIVIPEGMFPRQPHPDECPLILIKILKDFKEFLQNKGLVVNLYEKDNYSLYTITDNKNKKHQLLVSNSKVINILDMNLQSADVFLSLNEISEEIINSLQLKGACIIEITKGIINSSNTLGDELAKYLKHYGIHLMVIK
jgi:acetyltransferase-like isoleucine patch superfamily enzyme